MHITASYLIGSQQTGPSAGFVCRLCCFGASHLSFEAESSWTATRMSTLLYFVPMFLLVDFKARDFGEILRDFQLRKEALLVRVCAWCSSTFLKRRYIIET